MSSIVATSNVVSAVMKALMTGMGYQMYAYVYMHAT
jgi:hypothetical protein